MKEKMVEPPEVKRYIEEHRRLPLQRNPGLGEDKAGKKESTEWPMYLPLPHIPMVKKRSDKSAPN